MKRSGHIWIIIWALGSALYSELSAVQADTLLATDKELKLNVPVLTNTLPVQLGSSLSTQYAADYTPDPSAGMLRLETLTLEETSNVADQTPFCAGVLSVSVGVAVAARSWALPTFGLLLAINWASRSR